jgi:hypothetical protein
MHGTYHTDCTCTMHAHAVLTFCFYRRATSHLRYKHRRRPNLVLAAALQKHHLAEPSPGDHQQQQQQQQLHTDPSTPAAAPFPLLTPSRPTNRAMRRRPALLHESVLASCAQDPLSTAVAAAAAVAATAIPAAAAFGHDAGASTVGPSHQLRRLESHIWHAKRMSMGIRWGDGMGVAHGQS